MNHNRILSLTVASSDGRTPVGFDGFVPDVAYSGVDLFVGENASGKTIRGILGVVCAIEGVATSATDPRRPWLERRPEHTLARLMVQTAGGVKPAERDLGAHRGTAVAEADAMMRDLVGIPPTAWDLSDFARGTSGTRSAILDAVARAGGALEQWDDKRAIAETRTRLQAERRDAWDEPDGWATIHPLRGDYGGEAREWTAPLDEVVSVLTAERDGSGWLRAAEKQAERLYTESNRAQKDGRAAADERWSLLASEPPGDLSAVTAALDDTRKQIAALDADADEVARAQAALDRHTREAEHRRVAVETAQRTLDSLTAPEPLADDGRVQAATDALRGAEAAMDADLPPCPDAPALAEEIAASRTWVAAAEAAIDAPVPGYDGPEPAALRVDLDAKRGALDGYRQRLTAAREAATDADEAVKQAQQAGEQAREALDQAQQAQAAAQARVTALDGMTGADQCCRDCGIEDPLGVGARLSEAVGELATATEAREAAKANYQRARDAYVQAAQVARAAGSEEAEAVAALRDTEAAVERLAREVERAEEQQANHAGSVVARRRAEVESARAALRDAEAALSRRVAEHEARVERQRREALDDAQRAMQAAVTAQADAEQEHKAAVARHEEAVRAARARLDNAQQALSEWEATEAPTVPAGPDEEAMQAAAEQLAQLEAQRDAIRDHAQAVDQANAAEDAAEDARYRWRSCKALVGAIRETRDALARAAYGPIHDAARDLLADVATEGLPRPYFRGIDDFGADTERGPTPYTALSESEALVTAACLVYALATVAGNPCRVVLLDGIEAIQADHRAALVAALVQARQSGRVDNVMLTMATTAPGSEEYAAAVAPMRQIDGLTIHTCHRPSQGGHEEVETIGQPSAQARPVADGNTALDIDVPF